VKSFERGMQVSLSERESDQIKHARDIIIVGLFNVMLFEIEVETLSMLWETITPKQLGNNNPQTQP